MASNDAQLVSFNALLAPAMETDEKREALLGKLKIGIHSQVEIPGARRYELVTPVTVGAKGAHSSSAAPSNVQTVSQAFCSALSIAYTCGTDSAWEPIAQVVLDATYEATLWAAALEHAAGMGTGKVYLTFIGGGVFGNRNAWISSAIARACAKLDHLPLEVVVCHYRQIRSEVQQGIDDMYVGQGGGGPPPIPPRSSDGASAHFTGI